jgi:hypothetical protein
MQSEGFSVVTHSGEQRTLPVPCNYPRQSLGVCIWSASTFVHKRVEFGELRKAIGLSGTCRQPANDPFSR